MKDNSGNNIRLQKYIADSGLTSRRKAEDLIIAGDVKVNGETVREMGFKVQNGDKVYVKGKPVYRQGNKIYILLNKPRGYVSTTDDDKDRKTVMDLIDIKERIYPIGRLDYNTSGLLLLTNDGDFANRVSHPSQKVKKTYIAVIKGAPDKGILQKLEKGIILDKRRTAPCRITVKSVLNGKYELEIVLAEGRNRQIRRMFESTGILIHKLKRIKIGEMAIGDIPSGKWRHLTEREIKYLSRRN